MTETCPLLDELPWIKHGFFQREPTVPFTCTEKQKASPFLTTLGVKDAELYFCRHVFEDRIITPDEWHDGIEADAWVTDKSLKALAVKTADCIPLMLVCPKTRIIANVHISWHCALKKLAVKTIQRMKEMGADPDAIIAAIGPSLQVESFPVQADVRDKFAGQLPDAMDYFIPFEDRWKLDLSGIVRQQLKKAGVCHVWASPSNTFTSHDYYSWRKRAKDLPSEVSRNVSIILKINP
jgi:YfiH family protein